jgi:hypothetical protein
MNKDSFWNQLISAIAGLGVPGLVLLLVMSSTGLAGAAALTTALAALGGPLGMMGGIAVLGVLSMMSKGLAAYGLDAIFNAVIDELKKRGASREQILDTIMNYPISDYIKKQLKRRIELSDAKTKATSTGGQRVFTANSLELKIGQTLPLRELHSMLSEEIEITGKPGEGVWEGRIVTVDSQPDAVQVIFKQAELREFISTSRSLGTGYVYRLEEATSDKFLKVLVEVKVAEGFWLGVIAEEEQDDEIVNILYRTK